MTETITTSSGFRIALRRSARARRMTLRVPRAGGDPVLTLPPRVSLSEGRAFAEAQAEWLRRATSRQVVAQPVESGALLPVGGRLLRVTPFPIRNARIEGEALLIPRNRPAAPVIQAFLKHLAQQRLHAACDGFATALGRDYRSIVLRDTRSRWGSCSSDGRLMFSWRLAMAPPAVLNYVAAHEVAHLAHMDHSPRFWAQVETLMPGHKPYRDWLRLHGNELLAWQFRD
ncbi:M48 family metallopeptidase [Paracoccus methylarcula]|uniref:M48 family metallopeptidase n=1 Tax=Paracoccus methylarcula TaxID=72022 RepID=UPI001FE869B3|nr:SprT family zinc-dependent metalloprotease [Paracoccus methylarcula]